MQRTLTDHQLPGTQSHLVHVLAMDKPGPGGASHHYEMRVNQGRERGVATQTVRFQDGPIQKPEDVNGVTNEALLAIVLDRLRGFNGDLETKTGVAAAFKSRENALAITHIETALLWLQKRTIERLGRGVEGQQVA